ncbi:MAG: putative bifunctional diguanylate cyclase/phosphodiesterase [Gammaproteobacteria bacterium]
MSLSSIISSMSMDSMRGRYFIGVLLLSVLFIASVLATHSSVSDVVKTAADNSVNRNQLISSHRMVRQELRHAQQRLQSFLVMPDHTVIAEVLYALDQAGHHLSDIENSPWADATTSLERISQLSQDFRQLHQEVLQLMQIRTNAEALFPAFATINQVMLPKSRQFLTQMGLIMDELSMYTDNTLIQAAYFQFSQVREGWSDMVGAFRMYVAARTLSLRMPVSGNSEFEDLIEYHYKQIKKQLELMHQSQLKLDYGIQAEGAVKEVSSVLNLWYQGYVEIRKIYASPQWRLDEALMNEKITPLNERIWSNLNQIEESLIASSESDISQLMGISSEISSTLWLRLILTLVFIVLAFYAFELWLLEPVAQIAHALKMEADGNEVEKLPEANTLEARELVTAFETMRSQVRLRQMELEHQAMHDSLTGLPNRLFLRRKMIEIIESARKGKQSLALLMIDLNRFKEINDTLGHQVGDRVLREIGPRFIRQLSEYDVLARLGGDEFAVLLPMSDDIRARQIAQKLCASLENAINIEGQALQVGSSIGIALFPQHGFNDQALLQKADVAMYLAKEKNLGYALYDESQDDHSLWQLSLEGELKRAVEQDRLELHYQPKINCLTGKTVGVEALLRWNHPGRGQIPADEIQLLAEKTGLIKPLTKWVVERAVAQMADWRQKGIELWVSVNLSVWNLQDPLLYETVAHALHKWGVPASNLTLEITESAVMSDPKHALKTLNQLSGMGVQLSIDDFGIGFSSLQYLKKLPVNELKIDKSFVIDMLVDDNDAVIVHSTIDLAHNLGLLVIAEGVESQELFDLLQVLGADIAQGFHMSHAIPVAELEGWLFSSEWGLPEHRRLKIVN